MIDPLNIKTNPKLSKENLAAEMKIYTCAEIAERVKPKDRPPTQNIEEFKDDAEQTVRELHAKMVAPTALGIEIVVAMQMLGNMNEMTERIIKLRNVFAAMSNEPPIETIKEILERVHAEWCAANGIRPPQDSAQAITE